MSTQTHPKVLAEHLRREAFIYVRQSTQRQVLENTESTQRQYALRDRAVALGWPNAHIHIIDEDLGISGKHAENRDGFQHLVSEVALSHAGIVLGLEVSCSSCAPSPVASSPTRTACTIRRTSMTDSSSD